MIQIKYKQQGILYLITVKESLQVGLDSFCDKHCNGIPCKDCPYKTACSDIHRAIDYTENLIREENRKP